MNWIEQRDRLEAAVAARHPGCDARVDTHLYALSYSVELVVRERVAGVAWPNQPLVVSHLLGARVRTEAESVPLLTRALGVVLDPEGDARDVEIARLQARVRELEETLVARDVALRALVRAPREAA